MKKKIDDKIINLIKHCSVTNERALFLIVGDKAREQIPNLHYLYSQTNSMEKAKKLEILWCYKKELDLSQHQQKELNKSLKSQNKGDYNSTKDNPFSQFIMNSSIQRIKYDESTKVLGKTYGMIILQDFQAITPNLLCRTIETVQGGGLVIFLFNNMTSLNQLYSIVMDSYTKLKTPSFREVEPRFNERFIKSLIKDNPNFLALDSEMNILELDKKLVSAYSSKKFKTNMIFDDLERDKALNVIKNDLKDVNPIGMLVETCKTVDQAKCVMQMVDAIAEKSNNTTVSIFAGRGRGKSAAMGIAMASAIVYGYSNILVTAPSPDNLQTFFEFCIKGLEQMNYKASKDFEIVKGVEKDLNKQIIRINITRDHYQSISYINPTDFGILSHCEILVIDEAAAIPLNIVKELMINCLTFMASTIQGYEGTGRSLSLKLIQKIKEDKKRNLREIELSQAIRYADNDPVESWLNKLLCLDSIKDTLTLFEYPHLNECDLYLVNKDTLFAYKPQTEEFLNSLMSLFVSSHYKNTPNDLQLISDSTSHSIFILTKNVKKSNLTGLPEIYCVIQVAEEGGISKEIVTKNRENDNLPPGDLIPWTLSSYFIDNEFPKLTGVRIVRIATNPTAQRMGYGKRALELLFDYYQGKLMNLQEIESNLKQEVNESGKKQKKPLLTDLSEIKPPFIYYMGTSFGLTNSLYKFWKNSDFIPLYLRTMVNSITGEHSCIMIKPLPLSTDEIRSNINSISLSCSNWIDSFSLDFSKRLISLFSYEFKKLRVDLAYDLITPLEKIDNKEFKRAELEVYFSKEDFKRLQKYSQGIVSCNLIVDLLPKIAELFFLKRTSKRLSPEQAMIVLGVGLQKKDFKDVESEIDQMKKERGSKNKENNFNYGFDQNSVMGMFKKSITKFTDYFKKELEQDLMANDVLLTQQDLKLNGDESMKINPKEDMFENDKTIKSHEKSIKTEYYAAQKFGNNKRTKETNHK